MRSIIRILSAACTNVILVVQLLEVSKLDMIDTLQNWIIWRMFASLTGDANTILSYADKLDPPRLK